MKQKELLAQLEAASDIILDCIIDDAPLLFDHLSVYETDEKIDQYIEYLLTIENYFDI